MSSSREFARQVPGADGAWQGSRAAPRQPAAPGSTRARPPRPPAHYDPYLDGLFTYCLSIMCEHDGAVAALGEALAAAERRRERGCRPKARDLHRPWLYALARWACLRRLGRRPAAGEAPTGQASTGTGTGTDTDTGTDTGTGTGTGTARRRAELAALAWPEAVGTSSEQREALELAVRHQLPAAEVGEVIGLDAEAASTLLAGAACEVERTRTALAVAESGACPELTRLAAGREPLSDAALRRDLVRHVDECSGCRTAAERAMADGPWPGTAPAGGTVLTVLEAPRQTVYAALFAASRARYQHLPRFDRRGFPLHTRDRVARRARLCSRALTTTVIVAVLAAPLLALWAAYREVAPADERQSAAAPPVSAPDGEAGSGGPAYENAPRLPGHSRLSPGEYRVRVDGRGGTAAEGERGGRAGGRDPEAEGHTPGRLTVDARPHGGDGTLITLTASGGAPVEWTAHTDAGWLRLSRTAGTLRPGDSMTFAVSVDQDRQPAGEWSAWIRVDPSDFAISLYGRGSDDPEPAGSRLPQQEPSPDPQPSENPSPPPLPPSPAQDPPSSAPE